MHHHIEDHASNMGMMPAVMGAVGSILFAVLLAAVLYAMHRRGLLDGLRAKLLGDPQQQQIATIPARVPASASATEYLDMALAKGEIDVAEYHERRSALRSQG